MNAVQTAIKDSIRQNRIIRLTARYRSAQALALTSALESECDDYIHQPVDVVIDGKHIVGCREYWGTDDDGDQWRVHLHETD